MSRKVVLAFVAVFVVIFLAIAIANRRSLTEAYYRNRLANEIDAWRNPPPASDQSRLLPQFRDASEIRQVLSALVDLDAIVRLELPIRLYTDGTTQRLPAYDQLRSGNNPKAIFSHTAGTPRSQPQIVTVWCEKDQLGAWREFADQSLKVYDGG